VQDVERAFRRKAKKFHPDVGGSTTAMAALAAATLIASTTVEEDRAGICRLFQ
jgi:hypothetical protein